MVSNDSNPFPTLQALPPMTIKPFKTSDDNKFPLRSLEKPGPVVVGSAPNT